MSNQSGQSLLASRVTSGWTCTPAPGGLISQDLVWKPRGPEDKFDEGGVGEDRALE